jgi:hypothetical protein
MQRFQRVSKKVLDKAQNMGKGAAAVGSILVAGAMTNASAAITSADVDTSGALGDITTVFIATLGVSVLVFGYRKVSSIL